MLDDSFNKVFADSINHIFRSLPWSDWIEKVGNSVWNRLAARGLYEVQEYESTLEFLDAEGREAIFHKRQRVRYWQDNIIAYQDQAWGDGRILRNYRCSPGVPVDRYRSGHKTLILISLREVKHRGDIDEFNIHWGIHNGFRKEQESWETEISHRTKKLQVRVIFPLKRPPLRKVMIVASNQKVHLISGNLGQRLPDGRSQAVYELNNPLLNERYILKWDW